LLDDDAAKRGGRTLVLAAKPVASGASFDVDDDALSAAVGEESCTAPSIAAGRRV
jgi:hypothetical protein